MESIIREHLMKNMIDNNLFAEQQDRFLPRRSCVTQLLDVLDDWFFNYDNNVSILTDRKQRTCMNGTFSNWIEVLSGIPKGLVLGPILFLLYINCLPDSIKTNIRLFADDIKIWNAIRTTADCEQLQSVLTSLENWSSTWQQRFNQSKFKVLHIGKTPSQHQYYMHDTNRTRECVCVCVCVCYQSLTAHQHQKGHTVPKQVITITTSIQSLQSKHCTANRARQPLEESNAEKDLGVWVDDQLNFDTHTAPSHLLGLTRRTFNHLDKENLTLL